MIVVGTIPELSEENKKYVSVVEITDLRYTTNRSGEIEIKVELNQHDGTKERNISNSKEYGVVINSDTLSVGDTYTIISDETAEYWELKNKSDNVNKSINLKEPVTRCPVCHSKTKIISSSRTTECSNKYCLSRRY